MFFLRIRTLPLQHLLLSTLNWTDLTIGRSRSIPKAINGSWNLSQLQAPRSISASSCRGAHSANPAKARKVSVGLARVMMRSRTFGVRPIGLVNRKDPLSLDGFKGSGADFPEKYKPYLHDANTIVTSPHK